MKTLIILNPHAGSGRAGKLRTQIEPLLEAELGELEVAITESPQDVARHLEKAHADGFTRVIAIGGDGTNHALINELMRLNRRYPNDPPMTFGQLPIGTGQDWARAMGVPLNPEKAVRWIASAHTAPLDVGQLTTPDNPENAERYFLNIASAGISGMITERINRLHAKRPWTFYRKVLEALVVYTPRQMAIRLDGRAWFDGKAYVVAIANGSAFGHGMKIAPNARYNDGLFDVVLIEGMPRVQGMLVLNTVYSGVHLKRHDVHLQRARVVEIEGDGRPIGMELDGEHAAGKSLRFEILPGALTTLVGAST